MSDDDHEEPSDLVRAVTYVVETFRRDEAQGYRSRDRQFAIEILGRALEGHAPVPAREVLWAEPNCDACREGYCPGHRRPAEAGR